ncbi:class I SAM-dependent methyltransferase [Sneathiella chinensis]|uniref:NDP-hexose 3-C-methyltransferase n=1 Tax=Sneathiella chinensis TaxID=349750 RepID=A0ABQ5U7K7_9PROT|nr:class I SAM-dependent methyltransferase [Sneathiella chinensis]GLQ07898.1 NDP-hexose 3-C-methyltransferase [Sneathiella chinensis]
MNEMTFNGQTLLPETTVIDRCRSCQSDHLTDIQYFGETPLADKLVRHDQLAYPQYRAPLTLTQCTDCGLAQIRETVSPDILFGGDYPYYSSVSPALLRHFGRSAENLIAKRKLDRNSLVVEAASNDGYMLKVFADHGIPVLGIDPASGPAAVANANGIHTLNTFFTADLARQLADEGKQADLFLANNVLAHVPDLNGFVAGIATILKPDGQAVIEAPYLKDLVDHCEFDTIYHQHLCYFSLSSLIPLFERHGLHLNDVDHTDIHGGSLRLYISGGEGQSSTLRDMLAEERTCHITRPAYFTAFKDRLSTIKTDLHILLDGLKATHARIAGYGAAAKATTLLHYLDIEDGYLDCVLDRNENKQGWFMPGTALEIRHPDWLADNPPDYVMILAWNFANEIMKDQSRFAGQGGQFILPVPTPGIVNGPVQNKSL